MAARSRWLHRTLAGITLALGLHIVGRLRLATLDDRRALLPTKANTADPPRSKRRNQGGAIKFQSRVKTSTGVDRHSVACVGVVICLHGQFAGCNRQGWVCDREQGRASRGVSLPEAVWVLWVQGGNQSGRTPRHHVQVW
jgi:hypothetical protein